MGYKEKIGLCGRGEAEEQVPRDVVSMLGDTQQSESYFLRYF